MDPTAHRDYYRYEHPSDADANDNLGLIFGWLDTVIQQTAKPKMLPPTLYILHGNPHPLLN